jgi:hypothetical protein
MENSEAPQSPAPKRVKHRSPSFPSIDLEKALERAQRLWDVAGKHPAPLESAMKAWGYSPKSSGGLQAAGALKQYGLLEDKGSGTARQVVLTKAAQELLVYGADKDSPEWKTRVRDAALRPKIHRLLWEKYDGSLPHDSVMLPFLKLDLGFSDEAATGMLKRLRTTIAFAGVSEGGDTVSEDDQDTDELGDENGSGSLKDFDVMSSAIGLTPSKPETPSGTPETLKAPKQRTVQVTYSPTAWALVQAPFPLSEADWDAMMRVLDGMKPGLVQPDE